VKKGWETKTLGELCDILDRQRKPITKRDRTSGEYPYYGATGIVDYVGDFIFDEPLVLIGEDGAKWESGENTAFAVEGKIWVNNHAHVLRPHRSVLLDNWLIYHLNHSNLTEFVSGLTVPKLNQGSLREIPIPIPPLPEQKRIVGILDEAFAGIATARANAEKNLENARALFESHLNQVFTQRGEGWVEKKLGEVCAFENGDRGANYPGRSVQTATGIPFINAGHLTDNGIDLANMNYIPRERFELLGNGKIRQGDILFCLRGSVGKFASVGNLCEGAIASSIVIIRPMQETIAGSFLLMYLRSNQCAAMIERYKNGAAQPNLSARSLKMFEMPLPPLDEQKRIVASLDALRAETRRLETIYRQKLDELEALKKSLLNRAFKGEL
jgi:type I restriction enzyme S subunit